MPTRRRTLFAAVGAALAGTRGAAAAADLPSLIAGAKASVLPVGTWGATDSPRFGFRGTGFVVGDGTLVATNFHVLPDGAASESESRMVVMTVRAGSEGQLRRARVVATDRWRDLALLQMEGAPLPVLKLAESGAGREGQGVALMGFPIGGVLGFAPVTHRGIIASITTAALPAPSAERLDPRAVNQLRNGNFEVFQLDATAYPGNSGGPLLDADTGQVLGVVNMALVKGGRESALTNPTGISYAVPVLHLHELMKRR